MTRRPMRGSQTVIRATTVNAAQTQRLDDPVHNRQFVS